MKYAIVTDSVSCMPESEFIHRSFKLLPLAVSFEDVHYLDTISEKDGVIVGNEFFYNKLSNILLGGRN